MIGVTGLVFFMCIECCTVYQGVSETQEGMKPGLDEEGMLMELTS